MPKSCYQLEVPLLHIMQICKGPNVFNGDVMIQNKETQGVGWGGAESLNEVTNCGFGLC